MCLLSSVAGFTRHCLIKVDGQLHILRTGALRLTQLKIPFLWQLKCLIEALCKEYRLENSKSPSQSFQKGSLYSSWFCLNILGAKNCKLCIAVYRYSGIYSVLESLAKNQLIGDLYSKVIGLLESSITSLKIMYFPDNVSLEHFHFILLAIFVGVFLLLFSKCLSDVVEAVVCVFFRPLYPSSSIPYWGKFNQNC